jgi:hypothetical protein
MCVCSVERKHVKNTDTIVGPLRAVRSLYLPYTDIMPNSTDAVWSGRGLLTFHTNLLGIEANWPILPLAWFSLDAPLVYSPVLKMEAIYYIETSYRITFRWIVRLGPPVATVLSHFRSFADWTAVNPFLYPLPCERCIWKWPSRRKKNVKSLACVS